VLDESLSESDDEGILNAKIKKIDHVNNGLTTINLMFQIKILQFMIK